MCKNLHELDLDIKDPSREFFDGLLSFFVQPLSKTGKELYVCILYSFADRSSISDGSAGDGLNNQVCAGFELFTQSSFRYGILSLLRTLRSQGLGYEDFFRFLVWAFDL